MTPLNDLAGKPRPLRVTIRGEVREYLVHPLTLEELAGLQSWVDAQFPDPFTVASEAIRKGDYTFEQQKWLLDRAMNQATQRRHLIGTPVADEILFSLPGTIKLLEASIRKGRPDFTEEEAKEVRMHMTIADLQALQAFTGIDLVTHDPKATPPTSSANGSSTSRGRRRRGSTGGSSTTRP